MILFLVLYGCASATVEQQREADLHLSLGLSYLKEGNYQLAYLQFQAAHGIEPRNKDVLHCLGIVYLHYEDLEKSKKYLHDAISIDDNFSEAHNNLGIVYLKMAKWNESIEHFKKALKNPLYQNPESAYFNLGTAYYRLGNYELAITTFRDALKRAPGFVPLYYRLALSYNKIGRYGDASEMLTMAIEKDNLYNGDKEKFIQGIKSQYLKSDKEDLDLGDYLEIANY
jgi:type IV pilus biogenesis/stability protein PilW